MTFETFCKHVADMLLKEDRPFVLASAEATFRASQIIWDCERVNAVELFGEAAIDRTNYIGRIIGGNALDGRMLRAGVVALILPLREDFSWPADLPGYVEPEPLALPLRMAAWFIMAISDPNLALDGRNVILHGDPNGID